ncbi:carboxypeptidase-like regulatory domain-containing protein [Fulvivirga lutea]|uniref:Carboxypeptidase-like regulatory domain-containing protein n=1 Tax=Fulvivirga lutea TaxID=2810512 RepID=A0A974WE01_9BACT|nr:carboxypeptidase-like regulatory domain-containing protein [Fulvivirga lutea]QSE95970.1 carboxypeptidase-like regulatory domain-containing protein [Fulvivirga lutea]
MRIILFIFFAFTLSTSAFTQNKIHGRVLDKETGEAIKNVNIVIAGTTNGTITNSNGEFHLDLKENKAQLVLSHLTYQKLNIVLNSKKKVQNIELNKATYQMEVIDIGLSSYSGPSEFKTQKEDTFNKNLNDKIDSYTSKEINIIEDFAEFPEGLENLKAFFGINFRYPKSIITQSAAGVIYIVIKIDENGLVKQDQIIVNGDGDKNEIKNEVERLLSIMPRWYPAFQRGVAVPIKVLIPLKYSVI